ncbi:hypothetical protein LJR084_005030 [Variovorax sp. LjRoot84]|uniref:hypothetical protein n=1 Tax=Variovorax sp. LjRoot84 TaxID=3342340 RepID=UPI003ECF3CF3
MTALWKIQAEARLLRPDTPAVLTTGALQALVASGDATPPSPATFHRWMSDMTASTKLVEVIKGVYLNRVGRGDVSPAAAAHHVRARSVVSLAWVLEQAGITNNFGDTITCVIPTDPSWTNPQTGARHTAVGTFRFFAMPARLVMNHTDFRLLEDVRDLRFEYPRATPEKAFLDWLYLGASPRSTLTAPPMDLDVKMFDAKRLARVAKQMELENPLRAWMARHAAYEADPDVQANSSTQFKL